MKREPAIVTWTSIKTVLIPVVSLPKMRSSQAAVFSRSLLNWSKTACIVPAVRGAGNRDGAGKGCAIWKRRDNPVTSPPKYTSSPKNSSKSDLSAAPELHQSLACSSACASTFRPSGSEDFIYNSWSSLPASVLGTGAPLVNTSITQTLTRTGSRNYARHAIIKAFSVSSRERTTDR